MDEETLLRIERKIDRLLAVHDELRPLLDRWLRKRSKTPTPRRLTIGSQSTGQGRDGDAAR